MFGSPSRLKPTLIGLLLFDVAKGSAGSVIAAGLTAGTAVLGCGKRCLRYSSRCPAHLCETRVSLVTNCGAWLMPSQELCLHFVQRRFALTVSAPRSAATRFVGSMQLSPCGAFVQPASYDYRLSRACCWRLAKCLGLLVVCADLLLLHVRCAWGMPPRCRPSGAAVCDVAAPPAPARVAKPCIVGRARSWPEYSVLSSNLPWHASLPFWAPRAPKRHASHSDPTKVKRPRPSSSASRIPSVPKAGMSSANNSSAETARQSRREK
ncbi:hypothetical protein V6N12_050584 [Hibiscus sabdariffa]|uniref:Uncharacterized protein n=1 Tax=Hibiscus sabdariffa TaxID=183260 RepID=A0ABR2GCT4_9ROSI